MEQLLGKFDNPYVIGCILVFYSTGWFFTKHKEMSGWKDLFFKNRIEEIRQARDILKGIEKNSQFYDEALRQEIFYNLTGIRCRKELREKCQRLVIDGIVSTEGIFHIFPFIREYNATEVEIRLEWPDWIWATFLILLLLFGTINIPFLLQDLLLNVNPSTLLIRLRNLSVAALFFFGALKGLVPMVAAQIIEKRLKEFEEISRECVSVLPEQSNTVCEQSAMPEPHSV